MKLGFSEQPWWGEPLLRIIVLGPCDATCTLTPSLSSILVHISWFDTDETEQLPQASPKALICCD